MLHQAMQRELGFVIHVYLKWLWVARGCDCGACALELFFAALRSEVNIARSVLWSGY